MIDPSQARTDPGTPRRRRRWWLYALAALGALGVVAALAGLIAYASFSRGLPSIEWARRYRPPIVTEVWSGDEQLSAEFYNERRRVVPYERIPKKLKQAFVASEDKDFFDH